MHGEDGAVNDAGDDEEDALIQAIPKRNICHLTHSPSTKPRVMLKGLCS